MSTKISDLPVRPIPQVGDLFVLADADEGMNYSVTFQDLADQISSTGVPASNHELLTGLQGGTEGEHYHLTLDEYNNLGISTGNLPFFLSNGIQDNIDLTTGGELPFFLSSGIQDNISVGA